MGQTTWQRENTQSVYCTMGSVIMTCLWILTPLAHRSLSHCGRSPSFDVEGLGLLRLSKINKVSPNLGTFRLFEISYNWATGAISMMRAWFELLNSIRIRQNAVDSREK